MENTVKSLHPYGTDEDCLFFGQERFFHERKMRAARFLACPVFILPGLPEKPAGFYFCLYFSNSYLTRLFKVFLWWWGILPGYEKNQLEKRSGMNSGKLFIRNIERTGQHTFAKRFAARFAIFTNRRKRHGQSGQHGLWAADEKLHGQRPPGNGQPHRKPA